MRIGLLIVCAKKTAKQVKELLPETLEVGRIVATNSVRTKVGTRTLDLETW